MNPFLETMLVNIALAFGQVPLKPEAFAVAIASVESGLNDEAIGPDGERSMFQIHFMLWHQYRPHSSFRECQGQEAYLVTLERIQHLRAKLGDDPVILGSAWNLGVVGFKRHGPNDHGQRIANVYFEVLKRNEETVKPNEESEQNEETNESSTTDHEDQSQ